MSAQSWQLFYYRDYAWSNPLSSAGANGSNTNNANTSPAGKPSNPGGPATVQTRVPDGLRVVIQLNATASATAIKALTLEWVNPAFNPSRS
jgi:general secretion pathway protein J